MAIASGNLGPRVRWSFADRTEGVSEAPYDACNLADHVGDDLDHVLANRAALAAVVGVDLARLVSMAPVHGNDVAQVGTSTLDSVPEVDALVTTVPGIGLLVLAADCVPVMIADGSAGVIAVVHAGWRGVLSDVVGTTLAAMYELGARPDRTRALVGPAICGVCYHVSRERFDEVVAVAPEAASVASLGRPGLDLRASVVVRLRTDGITSTLHGGCTAESANFYSYRRDHITGRHGGVVTLLPAPGAT